MYEIKKQVVEFISISTCGWIPRIFRFITAALWYRLSISVGMAGLAIGHPMDTVKVLMQNANSEASTLTIVQNIKNAGTVSVGQPNNQQLCNI